ncbi:MAG: glycosyltransferase [Pseudanabaena sp.]|jgi:1,2-diacylglycerol 3-beta-glucosyltransferase|nr:glycosyltransferase family 2 protein [Pseudanabaena sp. M090S1SP2A07QC]MCA6507315.1 glycosyltransferase family 2 protein [Pseudanabaena sp. M172S2SP2A07QC]MCA6509602.1 glycosyltransferase family 2 protein [Pseudanabaena sp. M109S1SP2A07QC]MCA6519213.1 glycosyltransferase family 2 protein [Pseudanabaena sp. M110S1SP2A07QC]MCA6520750.1 glycosyltransferase family 2 protein [Pseudanabaena sp. M051S1SP2A07QC]MCA6525376.1 glycosyltransferase family 2 protein [Pseudanabaena sp. M179S2SP2A07QC]MCA
MHETDFRSSLQTEGDRRRLKTIIVMAIVYGLTIGLHFAPWSRWVLLGLFSIQALRLIFAPPLPPITPESNFKNGEEIDAEQTSSQDLPFFSLLASAKNEEAVIGNLVKNLCQIDYPSDLFEVWIVDDNSSDRTSEVLTLLKQKYPQLKTLRRGDEAQGGKSGALNQVLALTKGDIIGVFDADAQVPADVLRSLVPVFQQPKIGAVQLRKAIANASENWWTSGQSAEMALDWCLQDLRIRVGGVGELRGNGQFVRLAALKDCGGWNEQTITDDLDLTIRLHLCQWDIACLNFPAVQEEGVVTAKQLWHQRNRWAEGGFQRYLDYWNLLLSGRMGFLKTFDASLFYINQYLLTVAFIPDTIAALVLRHNPMLPAIAGFSLALSAVTMAFGMRRSYQMSWRSAIWQTTTGMIYMLHWIPVIASVTLRMCILPKRLKWVKTQHQGVGETILEDIDLQEIETHV